MRLVCLLILITLSHVGRAQKSSIEYGEVPMQDLRMTIYDQDSSAIGVVLADFGLAFISVFGEAVEMKFERHTRIKILKKDGLDLANITVLLRHIGDRSERISNIKASSYNLDNGKVVETELAKDGIFTEKFNKYFDQQKFTVPSTKEGSVIEYSYRVTSEFYTSFPNWEFQHALPTRLSEYWAIIPEVFDYAKYLQGYIPVSDYEEKSMYYVQQPVIAYHYVSKQVPAFKKEPFMTTQEDYISKISFALAYVNHPSYREEIMGSWTKFNEDLLKHESFGDIVNGSDFIKIKVEQIIEGITDQGQRIAAISAFIKENVEYNDEEDFYANPLTKILERRRGTSGDINLLLASMLRWAGFETDLVVLSTRDHGYIRQQFPAKSQFNYVICAVKIDGKMLLLDATEKYLPFDILPDRCLNGQGLIISAKNHGWIDITTKAKDRSITTVDITLGPTGELNCRLQYLRDGYDAQKMREHYIRDGEKNYVQDFLRDKQWIVEEVKFEDVMDFKKQPKEIYDIRIADHTTVAGENIYVSPFVTSQIDENPFKANKRTYPINFGNLKEKTYYVKILMPEGFIVEELPKSKVIGLPGNAARYLYNSFMTGNTINITSTFLINRSMFEPEEYQGLKEFYDQVLAKQTEQIVIKRK